MIDWPMPPIFFPLQETFVRKFAADWIDAWNSHNLDRILSHYDEEIVLISPVALRLLGNGTGMVEGKAALREYFKRGLQAYPLMRFDLIDAFSGIDTIVLVFANPARGGRTAEVMQLAPSDLILRVWANYDWQS